MPSRAIAGARFKKEIFLPRGRCRCWTRFRAYALRRRRARGRIGSRWRGAGKPCCGEHRHHCQNSGFYPRMSLCAWLPAIAIGLAGSPSTAS